MENHRYPPSYLQHMASKRNLNTTADPATEEEEHIEEEEIFDQIIARTDASSKRKVRGATKGLSVQKRMQSTQKLDIIIHPIRNRIVGEHAKDFKTEAGVMVKHHASVQYPRWKDIPADRKRKMWLGMKVYIASIQYPVCNFSSPLYL